MKLSISVEALNRLLGGDTELEIELRHQVAKQFTKDHLMPLVNSAAFQGVIAEIQDAIHAIKQEANAEIVKEVGQLKRDFTGRLNPELTDRIKELVKSATYTAVEQSIGEHVKNHIDYYEKSWAHQIDKKVNAALEQQIEKRIQEGIDARLRAAASIAY